MQPKNSVIQVYRANPYASFKITFFCSNNITVLNYRTPKSRHTSNWKICNIIYMFFYFPLTFRNIFKLYFIRYERIFIRITPWSLLVFQYHSYWKDLSISIQAIIADCFVARYLIMFVSMTTCIYLVSFRVMFYLLLYSTSNF